MKSPLKYLVVALGATLLSLPVLQAEDPAGGPGKDRREMRRDKMGERGGRIAEELGLSEEQKNRMKELNQQEKAELEMLRDGTGVTDDKRARAEAIHKSYKEKRHAIMTPEQREKAGKMRENKQKHRGEHREHGLKPADPK